MRQLYIQVVACAATVLVARSGAMALPSDLDTSFSGDGKTTAGLVGLTEARAVAVQSDDKIVVAGSYEDYNRDRGFAVTRYNSDGTLDTAFGVFIAMGRQFPYFGGTDDVANAIALQTDGKILVGGRSDAGSPTSFAVARLTTNGSLDTGWAGDGTALTDIGGFSGDSDSVRALAVQTDGKVIAAGSSYTGTSVDFALVRYNTNGSLDTGFDSDGKVTTDVAGGVDNLVGVALQSDGKIVVAGTADSGAASDIVVVRYNTNGSLDTGFDGDGKVIANIGAYDLAAGVVVQADGKIVVAGGTYDGFAFQLVVVRYNSNGSLDTSFDGDGIATAPLGTNGLLATSISLRSDGKIVVVGRTAGSTTKSDYALVRYNTNGSLDASFDGDGIRIVDMDGYDNFAYGVVAQASGQIVVAGNSYDPLGKYSEIEIARLNADGSLDTGFNGSGQLTDSIVVFLGAITTDVLFQPDGKVVASAYTYNQLYSSSDFAVVRYNADGSLDTSFDDDGRVYPLIGDGSSSTAEALALQADGKIVAVGSAIVSSVNEMAVVRYLDDGSLDSSFGGSGVVTVPFSPGAAAAGVAIQADGKIVLAGVEYDSNFRIAVARLNSDGSLDNTFDGDGKLTMIPPGATQAEGKGVVLTADGKIVVLSKANVGGADAIGLVRFNSNGSLDTTFDVDGSRTYPLGSDLLVEDLLIQPDGKLLVAGSATLIGTQGVLVRVNSDGSLDTSFSGDGIATTTIGLTPTRFTGAAIQDDGRVLVGGYTESHPYTFFLSRYGSDGVIDNSLDGVDGLVFTGFAGVDAFAGRMALHPSGRIALAGSAGANMAVAVYDGTPAAYCPPFEMLACTHTAASAGFAFKNTGDPSKSKLQWKWKNGTSVLADFGDPTDATQYKLCVYDGSTGSLLASPQLSVDAAPEWALAGTKWKYKNKDTNRSGIAKATLQPGDGKAAIQIAAKGLNLDLPTPPLAASSIVVTLVQDEASGGQCWMSTFSAFGRNDSVQFKAKY